MLALSLAAGASAAPTLGFVERFPGTSLNGWGGGAVNSNPGTGGFGGAGDGFARFSTPNGFQRNLGIRAATTPYIGNWVAAGITQVRLWLNDVGAADPLEMHFSVGDISNLWQYNPGFVPPNGEWAEFVVDLSSDVGWTQIIGTGTFTQALQGVGIVHVRHDRAPFMQIPDEIEGDVGLDNVLLTNGLVGVPPGGPVVPRALRLAPPTPNPSRGDVALGFEVFEPGPVRIEVVDATGRLVHRVELPQAAPGGRTWTWDGRDGAGRMAPPGYYRVRATGPSGGMSRALLRVE
jgi:hypothetical protein